MKKLNTNHTYRLDVYRQTRNKKQALGKLMATIGMRMDTERNGFYTGEVFRLLARHGNNPKINSRLRFMIRDLEELRVSCHVCVCFRMMCER